MKPKQKSDTSPSQLDPFSPDTDPTRGGSDTNPLSTTALPTPHSPTKPSIVARMGVNEDNY